MSHGQVLRQQYYYSIIVDLVLRILYRYYIVLDYILRFKGQKSGIYVPPQVCIYVMFLNLDSD